MSEERTMGTAAKITVVAALALVVLLFGGIGLRAYNNSFEARDLIGEERAKEIAVSHAGVMAEGITRYTAARDRENGVEVYEIDFKSGGYEFEYEINAETGDIMKANKDIDD